MRLPPSVSDEEFVRVVNHVGRVLYQKLGQLHGTLDDFTQQVAVWAMEALPRYDSSRTLDGFIFRHARNRALNWVRDHYHRGDPPCARCHAGTPCGQDDTICREYAKWAGRNKTKANLMRPLGGNAVTDQVGPETAETEVLGQELSALIDAKLPIHLRSYYLRMLAGDTVELAQRRRVQKAVAEIIGVETLSRGKSSRRAENEQVMPAEPGETGC